MLYCSDLEDQDGSEYQYDVHILEHELMHYEIQGRSCAVVGIYLNLVVVMAVVAGIYVNLVGGICVNLAGRDLCESGGGCGLPLVGGYCCGPLGSSDPKGPFCC